MNKTEKVLPKIEQVRGFENPIGYKVKIIAFNSDDYVPAGSIYLGEHHMMVNGMPTYLGEKFLVPAFEKQDK